jgi:hypothetical protein
MSQIIPIFVPTYISDQNYNPSRVQPRLLYYNGQVDCQPYYLVDSTGLAHETPQFPYFDNYSVVSGSQFPTSGSNSLLFFNEQPSYGTIPEQSLFSQYWNDYVNLLYNPRTRLINASAIIPLADYFKMELNDIVSFRGNYYHLRAINDYNLKNGNCKIQLLGPILPEALPFAQDAQPIEPTTTTTTTTSTSTTTGTTSTTTTTTEPPLSCTEYTFSGIISGASLTAFWVDCESGITQSQFVTAGTTYGPVCARTGTASGQAFTTGGDCTPTTTTTTTTSSTTTTTGGSATLAWSFSETGGTVGNFDLYVNASVVESRSNTSSGTYTVYVGDTINVEVYSSGCDGFDDYANAYCTGIINDASCAQGSTTLFTANYTVVSGDIGTTLNLDCFASCDSGCI